MLLQRNLKKRFNQTFCTSKKISSWTRTIVSITSRSSAISWLNFFLKNSKIHLLPVRAHQADLVVQQNQVDQEDQVDLADHYQKNQIQDFPADQVDLVVRVDL